MNQNQGFRERLTEVYKGYLADAARGPSQTRLEKAAYMSDTATRSLAVTDEIPAGSLQTQLRPLFGKQSTRLPAFGDHPDFVHLKGIDIKEYCAITTMFMDIASSTKLSLHYSLDEVHHIKNSFIRAAIELIQTFDGHVHRIMGDAVMAYFGGKNTSTLSAIINGINCAASLRYFSENIVNPLLQAEVGDSFAIRIGLDFGAQKDVLWSSYGYPGMNEVTATSFYVDVAAKLQQAAGSNHIMLGASIIDSMDFPIELLEIKKTVSGGVEVEQKYIEPNYINKDGQPMNYRQYRLKWQDYLKSTPLALLDLQLSDQSTNILTKLDIEIHESRGSTVPCGFYLPCSTALKKGTWLKFRPILQFMPRLPYKVSFCVENHGKEAFERGGPDRGNHITHIDVKTESEHDRLHHWEHAGYKGLHYMTIKIETHLHRQSCRVGVYVE